MNPKLTRRGFGGFGLAGLSAASCRGSAFGEESKRPANSNGLRIKDVRVTPIALPDPPILMSGGCHGPYFLRNVIEVVTHDGIRGIGETHGGQETTEQLMRCREPLVGKSALAYRSFPGLLGQVRGAVYSGIELACLDAIGRATGLRLCELLGGPVREEIEFAAYLFYRYAADHPRVLDDPRLVDARGTEDRALDQFGEVRTSEAMAEEAATLRKRFGFRVFKLKAGVLSPDAEFQSLAAIVARLGGKPPLRIDPNGVWTVETAVRIGNKLRDLPLEYYEDPVTGMEDMAVIREKTGLTMSTNMCVTRFEHIPRALVEHPIDVVLGDHHGWGGVTAIQTLGLMCDNIGWKLSQHSNNHAGITMAAMIHVGATVPQLTFASDTHYVWLPEGSDILAGKLLEIRDGRMKVPTAPGLGVELDRDKLARAHETYEKSGMRVRDDAFTMRRFEPAWTKKKL